jgi:hypothetical protein
LQPELTAGDYTPEDMTFEWQGGRVVFDPQQCTVVSLTDAEGRVWVHNSQDSSFGEFRHTLYRSRAKPESVFPEPLPSSAELVLRNIVNQRSSRGVQIAADFALSGFQVESRWFFHSENPWIDVTYRLKDGWSDDPQTVEFCFPFDIENPIYRYDAPGAFLIAGQKQTGGDDLPGANPQLYAGVTFAAISGDDRTALLLTPDSLLVRFGNKSSEVPAMITSMPMMNLTGNDWQFGQGGWHEWTFRYRIVLLNESFDPVRVIRETQQFATPQYLQAPGQEPILFDLGALEIDFSGGPLLAFKVAQDNRRLILRFWNVQDSVIHGSLKLPSGWPRAEVCDALERSVKPVEVTDGIAQFDANPLEILTIGLVKHD